MLTLLLGTDWTANRNEILRLIADDVSNKLGGRILMVPEFISHDTERRLCHAAGNTASRYAEVLSFSRLASRVADYMGHTTEQCLDNGGRVVAMAAAARQLHSKLKAYAAVETKPEFLSGLIDAVDEFKRCCITSADLKAASLQTEGNLAQKLEELGLLLEAYDSICSRGKRDPRDQMTWLLEELESCSYGQDHVFYIDGFPDFTRQNLAILEHLICVSDNVTISLNCDCVNSSAMAFQKAGETAGELIRCAKKHGIEVKVQVVNPREDNLKPLRERLFQGNLTRCLNEKAVRVFRTQSLHQECVAVAERIIELIHSGVRYRDISVVCSDPAAYSGTLEIVFERCHIPCYISGTESILNKSAITTVLAAMDAAFGGFEKQDVLRYLKSMLSPLALDETDQLEAYAMLWSINGSSWIKPWEKHPDGLGKAWTEAAHAKLQRLNLARETALVPLVALRNDFRDAKNLGQQVRSLYNFLVSIDFSGRLDSYAQQFDTEGDNRNAQILNQLWEIILNALEQLYDVLGETAWDFETFTRLFRLLLSQYDVGTIPSVLDSVTVGPPNAMRCQQTKHLFVLGVCEGSMPGYGGSTGVLTDHERTALREMGVPLTGGAVDGLKAEFADIYGVFCGAEESVSVSCSNEQPSFIYQRIAKLAGKETNAAYELGAALTDTREACAYLARFDAAEAAGLLGLSDTYSGLYLQRTHDLGAIEKENIKKLYGTKLNLSASQIDRQAECRFSYFLKYGLRANENKPATVDPAEFGTYVHAVLENTVRKIVELGGFQAVSVEDAVKIAREFSDAYAKERFAQLDTERMSYLFRRNSQELELIVRELWTELHNAKFLPVGFEVAFGGNGDLPAIPVSGSEMEAQLRGFVDRVDKWVDGENTYFRIVDYKTGKKDFDYCDIQNGLGLQMLLYLFALEQEGACLLGDDAIPAGVQYFPARAPLVTADGILTDEEATSEREKIWKRKGLLLSDEQVLKAMEPDAKPIRMPFTRKKDGSISGDLADSTQLQMLRKYVFGIVGKMVDDIASGCVTPNPYTRGSSHNACTFCPFTSVCHQQMLENRRNYKTISPAEFWEHVKKEVSERG